MSYRKKLIIAIIITVINIALTQIPFDVNGNVLLDRALGIIFGSVFMFPLLIMGIGCIWKKYRNKQTMVGIYFNLEIFILIVKIIGMIPRG